MSRGGGVNLYASDTSRWGSFRDYIRAIAISQGKSVKTRRSY